MNLIDRQAAIDALNRRKDISAKGDIGSFYNKIIENDIDAINALPSAEPTEASCWGCNCPKMERMLPSTEPEETLEEAEEGIDAAFKKLRDARVTILPSAEPLCIARYTLAVERRNKNDGQTADFISCVAFGKNGEFTEKYLKKGTKIAVTGHIQTGSYEKNGQRIYTTDVVVDSQEFAESKNASQNQAQDTATLNSANNTPLTLDGFMSVPDGIDEELPFS